MHTYTERGIWPSLESDHLFRRTAITYCQRCETSIDTQSNCILSWISSRRRKAWLLSQEVAWCPSWCFDFTYRYDSLQVSHPIPPRWSYYANSWYTSVVLVYRAYKVRKWGSERMLLSRQRRIPERELMQLFNRSEIMEQQRTRTLLCVQTICDSLNEALLNWKPSPDYRSWSLHFESRRFAIKASSWDQWTESCLYPSITR